jgi:hypothetical protein
VLVDKEYLAPEQIRGKPLACGPFVFLNACQVGAGSEQLSHYAGIAEAFLYAGAAGVIAPLWSVKDTIAHEIVVRFYAAAWRGERLADLLHAERARFGPASVSATCLAYQFFGHPSLRLHRATT